MRESVDSTKRQVERCKTITRKMLQFGRQGGGAVGRIDAAEQLSEIVRLMRPQAAENDSELILDLASDLPAVRIDPAELQQVVTNLVNNALHAMPEGGAVRVAGRRDGDGLRIDVEDEGTGIPDEVRTRFLSRSSPRSPSATGWAFGLLRDRDEVGRDHPRGEPGRGRCPVHRDAARRPGAHSMSGPGGDIRVMLVDDERDLCRSLAKVLRRRGMEVLTAWSGEESLEILRSHRVEVAIWT